MWSTELNPWPYVDQLTSATAEGADENKDWNCGESCIAMVVRYLTGVTLYPDTIKDIMVGPNVSGVGSTDTQVKSFLEKFTNTAATIYYPSSKPVGMSIIRSYIRNGRPILVARYFQYIGNEEGHWNVVIGASGDTETTTSGLVTADPWGGYRRAEDRDTFWNWVKLYNGAAVMVGIDRTKC